MAEGPVLFDAASAQLIAEAVRREMGRYANLRIRGGTTRPWDNESLIDGVASAACNAGGHGLMVPEGGNTTAIRYYNTLGDIEGGTNIVIGFCHRSTTLRERDYSGDPVPWILISAGCDSSELRFGRPRGLLWLVGVL